MASSVSHTVELCPPASFDQLQAITRLLYKFQDLPHFVYEQEGVWHIGFGDSASVRVEADGNHVVRHQSGSEEREPLNKSLSDLAREFTSQHPGKIFGHVGFNYALHVRGEKFQPGRWPIFTLVVPAIEIILAPGRVTIRGDQDSAITPILDVLQQETEIQVHPSKPIDSTDVSGTYKSNVAKAVSEIKEKRYEKVILSRAVEIPWKIDIIGTFYHGRRANNPKRSFCLSHAGIAATGFSPELVMSVNHGRVVTEPLAGTRSRVGTAEEVASLRDELLRDDKEIVEHVISVREACSELKILCDAKTVAVEDFMSVRERGSVQHLGSSVAGHLRPDKDAWDALEVLFPSITASGIPKKLSLQAIARIETRPRELYSGAVLHIEGGNVDAALVLRTAFQDSEKQWIQAGAGIVSNSKPERELTETREKMASVAPYIVPRTSSNV